MSPAAPRAALAALDAARPAIARLDRPLDSDARSAALVDVWSGVENGLRALAGSSEAKGTELLREVRQRQLLTFEQANALAALHAAFSRTREATYTASDADASVARDAFRTLEVALTAPPDPRPPTSSATPATPVPSPITPPGMRASPLSGPTIVPPPGESGGWAKVWAIAVVLLVVLGVAGMRRYGARRDRTISHAIDLYQRGQRDAALAEFGRAVEIDNSYALPHVYLARIARESSDLPRALQELQVAVAAEPNNELALREMGSYLLSVGNYELARKFYVRALDLKLDDRAAQGFLACTLFKLGRTDEARQWMTRAGQGSWSTCIPAAATTGAPRP